MTTIRIKSIYLFSTFIFAIISIHVAAKDKPIEDCEIESYYPSKIIMNHYPLNNEILMGNGEIRVSITFPEDNGYLTIRFQKIYSCDSTAEIGKINLCINPCNWPFGFIQTIDRKNGIVMIENGYLDMTCFVDNQEPTLWLRGLTKIPISIDYKEENNISAKVKTYGNSSNRFSIKLSTEKNNKTSYKKAHNRTKGYWNSVWEKSYIVSSNSNPEIMKLFDDYNTKRWYILNGYSKCEDIEMLFRSGDLDFIESYLKRQKGINNSKDYIHLLMEYFRFTNDESFLSFVAFPEYERILYKNNELEPFIMHELSHLSPNIVISPVLYQAFYKFNKAEFSKMSNYISGNDNNKFIYLQKAITEKRNIVLPPDCYIEYKLIVPERKKQIGKYVDGKLKSRTIPITTY